MTRQLDVMIDQSESSGIRHVIMLNNLFLHQDVLYNFPTNLMQSQMTILFFLMIYNSQV